MADLISRAAAIDAVYYKPNYKMAIEVLKEVPAVDAVPVVHAEWIEEPDRVRHYHCSNCGVVWGMAAKAMKHCPGCGAKMMNSLMWDVEDAT